jgi:hypothetical protein
MQNKPSASMQGKARIQDREAGKASQGQQGNRQGLQEKARHARQGGMQNKPSASMQGKARQARADRQCYAMLFGWYKMLAGFLNSDYY